MNKWIGICLVLASVMAASAFASDYQNYHGLFRIMPWTNPQKADSQVIEIRNKAAHKIGIRHLKPTALSFLINFNNEPGEIRTLHGQLEEATFRSLTNSLTVWPDGVLYFGKIQFRDEKFEIAFESRYGDKHIALNGPLIDSEAAQDLIDQDIVLEGYLRDDGSIQVSKIKLDEGAEEIIWAAGMFNSDVSPVNKQREYYVEGPHGRRVWIKKMLNDSLDQMIGSQVLAYGKYNGSGQLVPKFIREQLSVNDSQCVQDLMQKILTEQKLFQLNRKNLK